MTGSLELVRGGQLLGDVHKPHTGRARRSATRRVRPQLRAPHLVRRRRAQEHADGDCLNKEIVFLATPATLAKYADLGLTVHAVSPAEFARFIAEGIEKWAKIVKLAGIKPI